MKTIKLFLIAAVFMTALVFPAAAFASDLAVETSTPEVYVGDTVTVTVTLSGANMAVASGTFAYDYNLLTYAASTGGVSNGRLDMVSLQSGGTANMTAVIEFTATAAGDATISVSLDNILDYDGQALDTCEGSVSVTILSLGVLGTDTTTETIPPFTLDGVAATGVYGSDAELYVWRSVLNLTLPSGFEDTEVVYNGQEVGGAASTDEDGVILLYLSDAIGEHAGYYVFDSDSNSLHPYVSVRSVSQDFTFLWPDANVTPPDGYIAPTLTVDENTVPAWTWAGSDGSVYLVYVISPSGEKGFFQYIPGEQSLQRFIAPTVQAETAGVSAVVGGTSVDQNVFLALCVVCGILFFSVIGALMLYFSAQREKRDVIEFSRNKINSMKNDSDDSDEF